MCVGIDFGSVRMRVRIIVCDLNHQQPEVNYLPCFENDDLPCRLHEKHVVCRVNHHSRSRVDSSLQVAGGRKSEGGSEGQQVVCHGGFSFMTLGPSFRFVMKSSIFVR